MEVDSINATVPCCAVLTDEEMARNAERFADSDPETICMLPARIVPA